MPYLAIALLVGWGWWRHAPAAYWAVYGGLSVVCFVLYAVDKRAARRGLPRTRERTLLLAGLAGGWPGALLAQRWLRHKSAKAEFQVKSWATVVGNAAALVWALR